MLKNQIFGLLAIDHDDKAISAEIKIEPGHPIFKGHFPGQPVLPGACMLQILKEVLENALRVNIRLVNAGNIKFLAIVDPCGHAILQLSATYLATENNLKINAALSSAEMVCFKFQGVFKTI